MTEINRQFEAVEGYLTLGLVQDAKEILDSLPTAQKVGKQGLVLRMEILIMSQEWSKASLLAKSLCHFEPDDAARHVQAAALLVNASDYAGALRWLHDNQVLCRHLPAFHYISAKCHAEMDDAERAKESLKRAFRIQALLRSEELDAIVLEQMCEKCMRAMFGKPAEAN